MPGPRSVLEQNSLPFPSGEYMSVSIGSYVQFIDNAACRGTVFEFQDEGMVAGLKTNQKLKDMGCG